MRTHFRLDPCLTKQPVDSITAVFGKKTNDPEKCDSGTRETTPSVITAR